VSMKTSRKIFIMSSPRERVIRDVLVCEVAIGVSMRTTEGEAPKPECCCNRGGRCCVALGFEPELPSVIALPLSSSSSNIIIGAFPCDFEPGGRSLEAGELRRVGTFSSLFGGAGAGMRGSPEDCDLRVPPDLPSSIS